MKSDVIGYWKINPFVKRKIILNDDVVGNITKAQLEYGILKDLQETANMFNLRAKLNKGFLKQLEPDALAAVQLFKGKYICPKEVQYKVLSEEEFEQRLQNIKQNDQQGHYSQLM